MGRQLLTLRWSICELDFESMKILTRVRLNTKYIGKATCHDFHFFQTKFSKILQSYPEQDVVLCWQCYFVRQRQWVVMASRNCVHDNRGCV